MKSRSIQKSHAPGLLEKLSKKVIIILLHLFYFNNALHDTMMPIVRALLLSCLSTDGSLYMCTPVDPTFLILPYLVKSAKV